MFQRQKALCHRITQLQTALIDLLFPPQCVVCNAYGALLCAACAQGVEPIGPAICACCGRPQQIYIPKCEQCQQQTTNALSAVRIAALHTSPLREVIHAFKYGQHPELATPLARYLVALVQKYSWLTQLQSIDGVVPVPLYSVRRTERGYNQAELLASAFCHSVQLPLCSAWLVRQRSTRSQVGLTAGERQQNVQDAFVAAQAVVGKRILLVDDVYTTGATMRACAQAAMNAGASAVYGLALACPR
jgi:ComF family protein